MLPEITDQDDEFLRARLEAMNEFLSAGATFYSQTSKLPLGVIRRLVTTGGAALARFASDEPLATDVRKGAEE